MHPTYLPSPLWEEFYYIAHVDNLASIVSRGLLSHNAVSALGIGRVDVSDPTMQRYRSSRVDPVYRRPIHDYVPLYVNPKNSMLSARRNLSDRLVVLRISKSILDVREHVYSDGNVALSRTTLGRDREVGLAANDALGAESWLNVDDGARRRMAEVLIHPDVPSEYIHGFFIRWPTLLNQIQEHLGVPGEVRFTAFF